MNRPEWLKPDEKIGWRSVNRITYPFHMTQYGPTYDTEDECRARHPEADEYQRIVVNSVEKDKSDSDSVDLQSQCRGDKL